jgi:hypothetical protein
VTGKSQVEVNKRNYKWKAEVKNSKYKWKMGSRKVIYVNGRWRP